MATPTVIRTTPFQGFVSAPNWATPYSAAHTVDSGTGVLVVCFYPRTGGGGNFNAKWKVGGTEYAMTPVVSNLAEVAQIHRLIAPVAGVGEILIQHDNTRQKIIEGAAHNVTGWTMIMSGAQLSQAGTAISVSCNSAIGALVLDCFGLSAIPVTGTITPGSGQTLLFDIQNTTDVYHRAAGSRKVGTGGTTLMSWSKAVSAEMHIAAFSILGPSGQTVNPTPVVGIFVVPIPEIRRPIIVSPDPVVGIFSSPAPIITKTVNVSPAISLFLGVPPAIVVIRRVEIEYIATMTPDQSLEVNLG